MDSRSGVRICPHCDGVNNRGPRSTYCSNYCKARAFDKRNPKKYSLNGSVRRSNLKASYGITPEEWAELLAAQGNVCAICGEYPEQGNYKNRWATDHCHETGAVRGILCHGCNRGIGLLKDDPQRLLAAAQYLLEASNG